MEPASSVSESTEEKPNEIKTFVFLDLEATGLRGPETRILELSMVAVSRDELLGMNPKLEIGGAPVSSTRKPESEDSLRFFPTPKLPRVLHKYIRLYYPRKLILPHIEEITGLNNDLLHSLPGFTASSAEIISLFLELPKPLCLVAHNGDGYDFPLLMAELKNVCDLKSFEDVLCTDTLPAIKYIDALRIRIKLEREQKEIDELTSLAESFYSDDVHEDNEDISDTGPPRKRPHLEEDGAIEENTGISNSQSSSGDDEGYFGSQPSTEPPSTPSGAKTSSLGDEPPPLKHKTKFSEKLKTEDNTVTKPRSARRSLIYGNTRPKQGPRQSYKQLEIYKRLFGTEYVAHNAETDCLALLEICGHYSKDFVDWADRNAKHFCLSKPLWEKNKPVSGLISTAMNAV